MRFAAILWVHLYHVDRIPEASAQPLLLCLHRWGKRIRDESSSGDSGSASTRTRMLGGVHTRGASASRGGSLLTLLEENAGSESLTLWLPEVNGGRTSFVVPMRAMLRG